jgi:hypothetical protein
MKIEETSQEASRRRVQLRSLASFASLGGIEARKGGERRTRKRAHSPFYCSGPWRTLSRLAHPRSSRSERKKTETMKKLACIPSVHLLLILPFPSPDASMPRPSPGRTLRTGSCQPCPRARLFVVFLSCCHFLSEGRRLPLSSSCCSSPLSLSLSLFPQSLSLSLSFPLSHRAVTRHGVFGRRQSRSSDPGQSRRAEREKGVAVFGRRERRGLVPVVGGRVRRGRRGGGGDPADEQESCSCRHEGQRGGWRGALGVFERFCRNF